MAEINPSSKNQKGKQKKLSTRVDLTPLVDLGFLLITFFVFTSSISKPHVMKLNLPANEGIAKVNEANALTLILLNNDKISWYAGSDILQAQQTDYSAAGIREVVGRAKKYSNAHNGEGALFVFIKPTSGASYKNVVDVLDEMLINKINCYVLTDISDTEMHLLNISN